MGCGRNDDVLETTSHRGCVCEVVRRLKTSKMLLKMCANVRQIVFKNHLDR